MPGKNVKFRSSEGGEFDCYVVTPRARGKVPAIVIASAVHGVNADIRALAEKYADAKDMFYIGRHVNYPVAMEGALKIKEISYVHAEAYAAGELKHGPLALLTPGTPVVAIAVRDHTYEKMRSNVGEVNARGSPVLAIGTDGDKELPKFVDDVVSVPRMSGVFNPVPVTVALQLFAYHVARIRACPIDKPRNLAKSVTVE